MRRRLDAVLSADGDIDWTAGRRLPIVKRADMIEHRDAMLARFVPKGHGAGRHLSRASGSTGLPLQVTVSNDCRSLANNSQSMARPSLARASIGHRTCASRDGRGRSQGQLFPMGNASALGATGRCLGPQAGRWSIERDCCETPDVEFASAADWLAYYLHAGPNMAHMQWRSMHSGWG